VLIADERVRLGQWPLGSIIEAHPGSDGLTRLARIVTRTTVLSRTKLKKEKSFEFQIEP